MKFTIFNYTVECTIQKNYMVEVKNLWENGKKLTALKLYKDNNPKKGLKECKEHLERKFGF
jgi:hypothetical protein